MNSKFEIGLLIFLTMFILLLGLFEVRQAQQIIEARAELIERLAQVNRTLDERLMGNTNLTIDKANMYFSVPGTFDVQVNEVTNVEIFDPKKERRIK